MIRPGTSLTKQKQKNRAGQLNWGATWAAVAPKVAVGKKAEAGLGIARAITLLEFERKAREDATLERIRGIRATEILEVVHIVLVVEGLISSKSTIIGSELVKKFGATRFDEDRPHLLMWLAYCYFHNGDYRKAIDAYDAAMRKASDQLGR
eukprot:Skav233339  [mRNA]  locus=scaffold394:139149:141553:+ [translate_table: standard]